MNLSNTMRTVTMLAALAALWSSVRAESIGDYTFQRRKSGGYESIIVPSLANGLMAYDGSGVITPITKLSLPISTATQSALDAKQPLDADLTAIAAFSGDGLAERSSGVWSQLAITTAGRSIVTAADAAAQRSALGLRDLSWNDLIRNYPLVVPIRGFASTVGNYGSGQAVASVRSDGFMVFFQGTITKSSAADLDVLYDVPNGFAPPAPVRGAVLSYDGVNKGIFSALEVGKASDTPPQAGLRRGSSPSVSGPVLENNLVSVPQANCSGGLSVTQGSDVVSILLPRPLPSRSALKVCLYFHGASNDCYSHLSDAASATSTARLMQATINTLLNDGWVILSSNGGSITNHWGNPASYTALQAALSWLDTNLGTRSKTVVLGQSMGALTSLKVATSYPEITKWYGIYPVCALNSWAGTSGSGFQSAVFTAWGVASTGALATASVGYDPVLLNTSLYNGKDFRMTASTSDTVVPKASNTDVLVSYITGHCHSVNVVAHTGNHGDPTAFDAADILAFFNS